ncbi:hypothetical protein C3943_17050 [Lysinibacillus sp. B2A1]|nr:hypothetical protein C3943_17050 [Lysinibacillus sp. B2A1]
MIFYLDLANLYCVKALRQQHTLSDQHHISSKSMTEVTDFEISGRIVYLCKSEATATNVFSSESIAAATITLGRH